MSVSKFAKIVVVICLCAQGAYAEDLGSLKAELLNLKMKAWPMYSQQMAPAGGGRLNVGDNVFSPTSRRVLSARLFPTASQGVDLKSAFMPVPSAGRTAGSPKTVAVDNVLCGMRTVYGRIRWVVLHVGQLLCNTASPNKAQGHEYARRMNTGDKATGDAILGHAGSTQKAKVDEGTAMLTVAWQF